MNRISTSLSVRTAVAAILFAASCSAAFNTGDLTGVVTDPAGAGVANAAITVTSKETGAGRAAHSSPNGEFAIDQLKIGLYEVKAEAPGFRVAVTEATIRSGEISSATFKLEIGSVSETINVTDAVSPLDASDAQVGISYPSPVLNEVPVGRDAAQFAGTSPGVIPVAPNNSFLRSGSYNSNGGRGRANNLTIDNITATDIVVTGTAGWGSLSFNAIKEFRLITNNFSAEYGRNASSQLQVITKSGTNEFHGEAYEYLQNDKLNARDFFDTTGDPSITRFNQFGYSVGGPVRRNKTHFFQTYEGTRVRGAGGVRIAFVPTPAMLAQVTDPTSKALLAKYQLPAAATVSQDSGQVQQSAPTYQNAYSLSFRVDHQISEKDSLTARYSRFTAQGASASNAFISTNLANFGISSVDLPQNFGLTETHLVSARMVNEARFGFGRDTPQFLINSTVPLGPVIQFQNAQVSNFGQWNGAPQGRTQNTFEYSDTLSWFLGRHNLKAGADVYRYQSNSFLESSSRGVYAFANWSDFANGIPATYAQNVGSTGRGFRITNQFYFLQDDFRVTRNLTLNLGVRTEVAGGPSEVNGFISNIDLNCTSSMGAAGTGALGCLSTGQPSFHTNTNWAPRLGFAWSPLGDSRTVIRGGYGIAYDFIYLNPITNQRFLPPFVVAGSLTGASSFTGANSWANLVAGTALIQQQLRAAVGQINTSVLNYGNLTTVVDPNLRNPQVHQWNFGVERQITRDLVLTASYVGSKGNYLQRIHPINLINDPRAAPATSLADETARLADFTAVNAAATGTATRFSNRIDPRFNAVNLLESSANSNYHSFQFLAKKNFTQGHYVQVAYTFSKSIDDVSDALGVLVNDSPAQQNPRSNRDNRAVSEFDMPQRLVITHVFEPTWFRHLSNPLARRLADGWGFAGITSFESGFPATLDAGARRKISPLTLTGITGGPVRPSVAGPVNFQPQPAGSAGVPGGLNSDPIQPISAYAAGLGLSQPLIGNFGTLGRNALRLNGWVNFDWNIYKNIQVQERVKMQLRAEFYNIFNNTSFGGAQLNISQPAFGQYTATQNSQRYLQVGARIIF